MTTPGPTGSAAWRTERRAAVRRHHPDAGGSAAALQAALDAVDVRHGVRPVTTSAPPGRRVVVVDPPPTWRRVVRGLRRRIPRGWPGHVPARRRHLR